MTNILDDTDLDALLAKPLVGVSDDEFTSRLMERLAKKKRASQYVLAGTFLAATLGFVLVFPFSAFDLSALQGNPDLALEAAMAALLPIISFGLIADS